MTHLIDKDVLVAAIDTIMKKHMNFHKIACINGHKGESCSSIIYAQLEELLSFINTLEVKDVDLEKYYHDFLQKEWFRNSHVRTVSEMMAFTAKHFFELGMQVSDKVQKGE